MTQYDAMAQRALAMIARKGSDVFFPTAGTPQVFDETTNTWSGGSPAGTTSGKAVQVQNDVDVITTLGIVGQRVVTLLIAALDLVIVPIANAVLTWAGVTYTIRNVDTIAPDGTALVYTVVGVA